MLQVYGYVFWTVAVRRAMNGTMVTVLMSRLKSRSTSNTGTVMYVAVSCIWSVQWRCTVGNSCHDGFGCPLWGWCDLLRQRCR